jgi:hypothetical protein
MVLAGSFYARDTFVASTGLTGLAKLAKPYKGMNGM